MLVNPVLEQSHKQPGSAEEFESEDLTLAMGVES